jgi:CheY-like chemotaxis protein
MRQGLERGKMTDKPTVVLLVEDNPGDAALIRNMLRAKSAGIEIRHVNSLSKGLEQIQKGDIDVVLLDLDLPDSSGLETLSRTRTRAPSTPIIVITGLAEKDVAVRALDQGARDFFAKEFLETRVLTGAIQRAVSPVSGHI